MKLANIVTNAILSISEDFKIVKDINDIDISIPTLIIGQSYVEEIYPDFDITEMLITDNIYWTVDKYYQRDKFEIELNWFINKVYDDLIKDISYIFVDPIQYNSKTLYKIIKKIYKLEKKVLFINNNMIYIYSDTYIFGLDIKLLQFINVDTIKIINKLKKICTYIITNKEIGEYMNNIYILKDKYKYIPYYYFLKKCNF
jgi:predicted Zn-dependent protease